MPPISPPPARGPRNGELPAYVSNGLIGLRVREVPLVAGMAIVSGVAGEHPIRRIEAAAPSPYPLAGDIAVGGVWLSDQPWTVRDLEQSYDFETAELTSRFTYTVAAVTLAVEVVTLASRTAPSVVLQEVAVTPDKACTLGLRAVAETAGLRGRVARRLTDTPGETEPVCDGSLLWETEGGLSACGVALHSEVHSASAARTVQDWDAAGPLVTTYEIKARAGRTLRLRQVAAMVPSLIHERPDEEAVRRVARARMSGFNTLRKRNRDAWSDLWRGRIVVHGAKPEHQALIDAAFFYLNSSVHEASPSATSIFGLATWHDYHYYYGHVMWDVDAFCTPPLILLQPSAARAILDFRTRGLPAAAQNARLSKRDGLQFPWEAAPLSGQEATPGGGGGAAHEDHGSLHVAHAFSFHADITGDRAFLAERAWPVLSGLADWIVSRGTRTERGVEFLDSMGPAEVPTPPDNDAFTLMAAADILRRAIDAAERLERPVAQAWRATLADLYLPSRSDGVTPTHDGFRIDEAKGATPSPLAGLFPYGHPASVRERRRTLDFYLARWRDYVGAPMLPALYMVWASMAGDRDLALKLFEEGYAAYDHGRFHQCLEYRLDHKDSQVPAGPFFANLGGLLLGLLFGLTGLRVQGEDAMAWPDRAIVLPRGWRAIEVGRVWIGGRPAALSAEDGAERATIRFL